MASDKSDSITYQIPNNGALSKTLFYAVRLYAPYVSVSASAGFANKNQILVLYLYVNGMWKIIIDNNFCSIIKLKKYKLCRLENLMIKRLYVVTKIYIDDLQAH